MKHLFKNTKVPQFIKNKYKLEQNYFVCKKCTVCNFIVASHKSQFDIFFYNDIEIYYEYTCYTNLAEEVKISCEELGIQITLDKMKQNPNFYKGKKL